LLDCGGGGEGEDEREESDDERYGMHGEMRWDWMVLLVLQQCGAMGWRFSLRRFGEGGLYMRLSRTAPRCLFGEKRNATLYIMTLF
jgi:hypothetical protein